MNLATQFGKRIRYLREIRKWSQEDLAFEADINKNYLSDLERGTRNPTLKIMGKLANAFNITLEKLCQGL